VGLTENSTEVSQAKATLKRIVEEEKIVSELENSLKSGACVNMDHSTIGVDILEGIFKKRAGKKEREKKSGKKRAGKKGKKKGQEKRARKKGKKKERKKRGNKEGKKLTIGTR
jgi:hypothetical protein